MAGKLGTSRACFTCCGSTVGTLGRRVLRRCSGCRMRRVWRKRRVMRRKRGGKRTGGVILVREVAEARAASFDDGEGVASDAVALGTPQSGVAAAGEVGDAMVGTEQSLTALPQKRGLINQIT